MKRIKISVIVPIYNTLDYLERCVDSIRMQTYENLEILLIDDGSTDGTGELCDTLARQDNRIRVYHKENGGASSARNFGLQNAIGDYIGFIDSDDYIDTDIYQSMIELIAERDYDIVQMSRDERDEADNRLEDVCIPPKELRFCDTETFLKELLLHQADCSFCTKLVKRELFGKDRFPEGKLNEDFKLLVPLLMKTEGVAILPKQAYHVVCRSNSTTRQHSENSFSRVFMDIVDNADEMQTLIDEHYPAIHDCALRFNLYQRLEYMLHVPITQMTDQNDFYQNVKKYLRRHIIDMLRNPYLTEKNKKYLLVLTIAPRTARKMHKAKKEKELARELEKESERESS
ncbi:MAG: glycosyltransferase family 2 protein [Lachnospiraceae bacterium]|nr:glycosyltransferase family 2 protein [Lachnospiraceae bacterium]